MTTQPDTQPPAPPAQQQQPPAQQPPSPDATDHQRIVAAEQRLDSMDGKLDQIVGLLSGPGAGRPAEPQPDIGEEVRKGVAEIEEGKKRDAAARGDREWRAKVDQHMAEHRPRQPQTGLRSRMQRIVHGKPAGE